MRKQLAASFAILALVAGAWLWFTLQRVKRESSRNVTFGECAAALKTQPNPEACKPLSSRDLAIARQWSLCLQARDRALDAGNSPDPSCEIDVQ